MIRLGLANAATIEDLARIARRHMPAIECGYLESGTGAELALARNRAALFGGDYNLPIGISPVGLVNALWPGADNMLATAARAANVPYGLSTVGTTSIEASGGYWAGCRQSGFRRAPCESCRDRWVMTHDSYRPIPGR